MSLTVEQPALTSKSSNLKKKHMQEAPPATPPQQWRLPLPTPSLSTTLISLSETCTTMKHLKRIHALAIRTGLNIHTLLLAKMFRFASVSPSGDLVYANKLFTQMPQPNTFFYNTLIRGYSKSQTPLHSTQLFHEMRRNSVPPDEFTFTFLLKANSGLGLGLCNTAGGIHGQVLKFGFCAYLYVQNALINLYGIMGVPCLTRRVFDEIVDPDVVSWSGLVVAHVRKRELDEARILFDGMPERDVVSWTAMISGYTKARRSSEALELFREMRDAGVRPDEVTMVSVISACTNLGDLEAGLYIHRYIDENGFGWMISLCNALIDMYAKCGCMDGARQVFDKMERKSMITWNSIISAYGNHGDAKEAVELFNRMRSFGVWPDGVTFLALLTGYTHNGWVDEGRRVFSSMKTDYGIEPSIEHYGCMVDMLGRGGHLEEAYDLIINMPIPSNDVVWGALLSACRIYGDVDMGERIVKKLLELKPDEGGYYILLCDIYVAAGRQAEAIEMRRTMEAVGAQKTTGYSWVGA